MQRLKDYDIAFTGLKLGDHQFDFELNNEFFYLFNYQDFNQAEIKARIDLIKKENSLELTLGIEGSVELPCDVSNELFWLPIANNLQLVIKFGEELDDSREDVLIIPANEHKLNVAQYLYELSVLAVPLKRVSPAAQEHPRAQGLMVKSEPENEQEKDTDPRWDKLKDLLN